MKQSGEGNGKGHSSAGTCPVPLCPKQTFPLGSLGVLQGQGPAEQNLAGGWCWSSLPGAPRAGCNCFIGLVGPLGVPGWKGFLGKGCSKQSSSAKHSLLRKFFISRQDEGTALSPHVVLRCAGFASRDPTSFSGLEERDRILPGTLICVASFAVCTPSAPSPPTPTSQMHLIYTSVLLSSQE